MYTSLYRQEHCYFHSVLTVSSNIPEQQIVVQIKFKALQPNGKYTYHTL
jgi:hypothetical protein